MKREADVKTVQNASAERAAAQGRESGRAENKESQTRQTLVVWTVYAKLGNHFPAEEVVRIGDRDYARRIRVIQADENPSAWRSGNWIPRQCFKQTESICVSTLEPIRYCRREKTPDAKGSNVSM